MVAVIMMVFGDTVKPPDPVEGEFVPACGVCEASGVPCAVGVLCRNGAGGADLGGTEFCIDGLKVLGGTFCTADRDDGDGDA